MTKARKVRKRYIYGIRDANFQFSGKYVLGLNKKTYFSTLGRHKRSRKPGKPIKPENIEIPGNLRGKGKVASLTEKVYNKSKGLKDSHTQGKG